MTQAFTLRWRIERVQTMIESIEFTNYKALANAKLPLAPFTLLMGPNGSGKSSVLDAIQWISTLVNSQKHGFQNSNNVVVDNPSWRALPNVSAVREPVIIKINVRDTLHASWVRMIWNRQPNRLVIELKCSPKDGTTGEQAKESLFRRLAEMKTYSLDPATIAASSQVNSEPLGHNGEGLASVLDDMKDNYPEKWELLVSEFREWLPEYDHIQFSKPSPGEPSRVSGRVEPSEVGT